MHPHIGNTPSLRKQTIRGNGRWAKLDRNSDGSWYAALGIEGKFKAERVVSYPVEYRTGAAMAAGEWIAGGAA